MSSRLRRSATHFQEVCGPAFVSLKKSAAAIAAVRKRIPFSPDDGLCDGFLIALVMCCRVYARDGNLAFGCSNFTSCSYAIRLKNSLAISGGAVDMISAFPSSTIFQRVLAQ